MCSGAAAPGKTTSWSGKSGSNRAMFLLSRKAGCKIANKRVRANSQRVSVSGVLRAGAGKSSFLLHGRGSGGGGDVLFRPISLPCVSGTQRYFRFGKEAGAGGESARFRRYALFRAAAQ